MLEELTAAQIAVRLGLSERSVQRKIKEGKLQAQPLSHSRYAVSSEDLEKLKLPDHVDEVTALQILERRVNNQLERQARMEEQLRDLTARVEWLEHHDPSVDVGRLGGIITDVQEQVSQLQAGLDELRASRKPVTPGKGITAPAPRRIESQTITEATGTTPQRIWIASLDELPEGALEVHVFAAQNGIENTKSFRDRIDRHFNHYAMKNESRPRETRRFVDQETQQKILSWLQGE